jgi:hypothetical protein
MNTLQIIMVSLGSIILLVLWFKQVPTSRYAASLAKGFKRISKISNNLLRTGNKLTKSSQRRYNRIAAKLLIKSTLLGGPIFLLLMSITVGIIKYKAWKLTKFMLKNKISDIMTIPKVSDDPQFYLFKVNGVSYSVYTERLGTAEEIRVMSTNREYAEFVLAASCMEGVAFKSTTGVHERRIKERDKEKENQS